MAKTPQPADGSKKPEQVPLGGDVRTQHPDLMAMLEDYRLMRDCRAGETMIKLRAEEYLPMPTGFGAQSDSGRTMYDAYRKRAQFPDILSPTVLGLVGVVHRQEPEIEGMDGDMELLWERATPDGLPLETLHRRITEEILTVGRVALLADLPPEGADLPWIALYKAESIINWSDSRDFFVLEEDYRVRNGFAWDAKKRYRVLQLGTDAEADKSTDYNVRVLDPDGKSLLEARGNQVNVAEGENPNTVTPTKKGGGALDFVPIVVAGSRDLSLEPDELPLVGVGRSALAIYRLDADYRHQLYWSGQETLVIVGLNKEDAPSYVGAGVVLVLPADSTAMYVGPTGAGIAAHKIAIDDEKQQAAEAGGRIFAIGDKKAAESGEALKTKARAATANLLTVALTSAAALEQSLRHCARLMGRTEAQAEKIIVKPDLSFVDTPLTPTEATQLMGLWMSKAISYETLYENLQRGEIASQERDADEEQEQIALEESATLDETGTGAPGAAPGATDTGTDETPPISDEELAATFAPELLGNQGA